MEEGHILMKFTVELVMNSKNFKKIYWAGTLSELFNDINKEFPTALIVSIIGGG